jgi:hypothetical protein
VRSFPRPPSSPDRAGSGLINGERGGPSHWRNSHPSGPIRLAGDRAGYSDRVAYRSPRPVVSLRCLSAAASPLSLSIHPSPESAPFDWSGDLRPCCDGTRSDQHESMTVGWEGDRGRQDTQSCRLSARSSPLIAFISGRFTVLVRDERERINPRSSVREKAWKGPDSDGPAETVPLVDSPDCDPLPCRARRP